MVISGALAPKSGAAALAIGMACFAKVMAPQAQREWFANIKARTGSVPD
jgi:hypothetical protein